jgi:hypothetical protein
MVTDAGSIVQHIADLGIPLAGMYGNGKPKITQQGIELNGAGDDAHEALVILPRPPTPAEDSWQARRYAEQRFVWAFCKTVRKPYDVAVAAVLLRCHQLAPNAFVIGSDGFWDEEWRHGALPWGPAAGLSARGIVEALFGPHPTTELSPISRSTTDGPSRLDPPMDIGKEHNDGDI